MAKKKKTRTSIEEAKERFAENLVKRARESGSDYLRGENQDAQIRAMMAKDPEGKPTPKSKSYGKTKKGKSVGGHYD